MGEGDRQLHEMDPAALAFETAPAIMWMFAGPDHRVVAANRLARASVGDRPGLIGTPVRQAVPEADGYPVLDLLDQVARTGEPVLGLERRVEVDLTGGGAPAEGYFTYSVLRHTAPDGSHVLVAHVVDATDSVRQRRAAEAEVADVRQRLAVERDVALRLQRGLLPAGLPLLPDLGLGAAYVPAGEWLTAGGDWYDVVPMPGDRVGLVLGDVVGHGPTASGVMGQLRAVAAERLVRGGAVVEVLTALDAFAALCPDARGSTVCVAVFDRLTRVLEHGSRGHPRPLLLDAEGVPGFLDGPIGPPLAFGDGSSPIAHTTLTTGETLVLYSDGVVEAPGRGFTESRDLLADRVSRVAAENPDVDPRELPTLVCAALASLVDNETSRDDVSVLAATVLAGPGPRLSLALPGTAEQLAVLHRELNAWLDALSAHRDDRNAIALCVVEAVTNSIEHGYRDHSGTVTVLGELDGVGGVRVTVSDAGTWREPVERSPYRGRGMLMMRECSDHLNVDTAEDGTTVTMRRSVRRPPVPLPDADVLPRAPVTHALEVKIGFEDSTVRIAISGIANSSNAEDLRVPLREAARSGVHTCVLLLDGVELLTSAALRVLFEQVADLRATGCALRMVAAPTSPAAAALSASGLDRVLAMSPTE
ncbi:SpoIIE family protein phosphatase [Actinokineospora auranticolor]|uniref:Anti-anti-sigma factor n=1 Tax=Actinokineospora auranticolor TaxID=155976 RepID=A0A2S6H0B8_9PSEU|nr:SpoIIE family protein phosphatase [Actinokineospora auranticolor]PPK70866.1 anti-anti-sigma factor [Actinokineospora auranticolor]